MPRIHVWYFAAAAAAALPFCVTRAVKNCQEAAHGAWVQKASNGHTFSWQTQSGAALTFCRMFLTVSKNQSGIKVHDFSMSNRVETWQRIGFLIIYY